MKKTPTECQCCKKNIADKTNTHYLSDSIIRSCLNENGVNKREKGLMFKLSTNNPFSEFNFQRETSLSSVEKILKRSPSEDEIEKAKQRIYSVDNIFCSDCENKFTDIETKFTNNLLEKFRGNDFSKSNIRQLTFKGNDSLIIRRFFLLQFYRTVICERIQIPESFISKLYKGLFEGDDKLLRDIPIKVTYLNTVGEDVEYTSNIVGTLKEKSGQIIFFNDFVIQASENIKAVKYMKLVGVNDERDIYKGYNCNEGIFVVDILFNDERLSFLNIIYEELAPRTINVFQEVFVAHYRKCFTKEPDRILVEKFMHELSQNPTANPEIRYSKESFISFMNQFFKNLIKK